MHHRSTAHVRPATDCGAAAAAGGVDLQCSSSSSSRSVGIRTQQHQHANKHRWSTRAQQIYGRVQLQLWLQLPYPVAAAAAACSAETCCSLSLTGGTARTLLHASAATVIAYRICCCLQQPSFTYQPSPAAHSTAGDCQCCYYDPFVCSCGT